MVDIARQAVDDPDGNRAAPRAGDKSDEAKRSPHDDFIKGDIFSCDAITFEQRCDGCTRIDAGRGQIRR